MRPPLLIRPAITADTPAIWAILEPTVRAGETFAMPRDMSEADAITYWTGPGRAVFVAEADSHVVGSYFLRGNQLGGGDHVANCAYITDMALRGRGIARQLAEHSLEEARQRGFAAMQFNFVVSSNESAIHLGRASGSKLSAVCRAPSGTPASARSTLSSCTVRFDGCGGSALFRSPLRGLVTGLPARISRAAWHCSHP